MPLIPRRTSVANPANTSPPRPCGGGMQPLKPLPSMIHRRLAAAALFAAMDGLWRIAAAKKSYNITSSGRGCFIAPDFASDDRGGGES